MMTALLRDKNVAQGLVPIILMKRELLVWKVSSENWYYAHEGQI